MISEIEKYAKENKIPIIEAESKDFILAYIKDNNCQNILEIGSAIGYSAIIMANVDKDIKVTTIERDQNRYDIAVANINDMKLNKQITIYCDDALTFNTDIFNEKFDLIFIDAAKAQYQKFFEKYEKFLKDEGTIVVDNIDFHGFVKGSRVTKNRNTRQLVNKIRKFIDWLESNENYNIKYHELGDGIFIVKRKV